MATGLNVCFNQYASRKCMASRNLYWNHGDDAVCHLRYWYFVNLWQARLNHSSYSVTEKLTSAGDIFFDVAWDALSIRGLREVWEKTITGAVTSACFSAIKGFLTIRTPDKRITLSIKICQWACYIWANPCGNRVNSYRPELATKAVTALDLSKSPNRK